MRIMVFILVLVLVGLQYKLWLGDGSIPQWRSLQEKITLQQQENADLALRNRAMEADIQELKQGEQSLEEQARAELGMIKEDEVYYQFLP